MTDGIEDSYAYAVLAGLFVIVLVIGLISSLIFCYWVLDQTYRRRRAMKDQRR